LLQQRFPQAGDGECSQRDHRCELEQFAPVHLPELPFVDFRVNDLRVNDLGLHYSRPSAMCSMTRRYACCMGLPRSHKVSVTMEYTPPSGPGRNMARKCQSIRFCWPFRSVRGILSAEVVLPGVIPDLLMFKLKPLVPK